MKSPLLLVLAIQLLLPAILTAATDAPVESSTTRVSAQGLFDDRDGPGRSMSPSGAYALEVVDVRGGPHELRAELRVTAPGGRRHHAGEVPGQAFWITDAGRIVTIDAADTNALPTRVRVHDLDGDELWSCTVPVLTDPALSADGLRLVYRDRHGVATLDLATAVETRYPRYERYVAGFDGRLAGVALAPDGVTSRLALHESGTEVRSIDLPYRVRRLAFSRDGAMVLVLAGDALTACDWTGAGVRRLFTAPAGAELRDLRVTAAGIELGLRYRSAGMVHGELVRLSSDGQVLERLTGPSLATPPALDRRGPAGEPLHASIPWPLAPNGQHEVGNTYGEFQFYGGSPYPHPGVDVMGEDHQPVYAVKAGIVKAVLTTSGSLHWRVAIGDSVTASPIEGFLYAHLDQPSIAVNIGDLVEQGDYLGDLVPWTVASFTHIHFARIEEDGHIWSGDWLCTENPHLDFENQSESEAPVYEPARGNDLLAFCVNETSSYQQPDALQGEVDIIAHVGDRILGDWVCTVQEIRYTIYPDGAPQAPLVDDKLSVRFDMALDTYQGGPFDPFLVDLVYKQDSTCPTNGNYDEREFYHIITNSNGDEIYEEADRWEAWDTTLLPDGDYLVRVTAIDVAGNAAVDSMLVTTDNGNPAGVPPAGASPVAFHRVHPNPIVATSAIDFSLAAPERISLAVFDATGRRVRTLIDHALLPAGRHAVVWDGTDLTDRRVASGIYFLTLDGAAGRRVDKVVVAR